MPTTVFLLVIATLGIFLLPEKYRVAVLRAPISFFGGMLKWILFALALMIAVLIASYIAQIFFPS